MEHCQYTTEVTQTPRSCFFASFSVNQLSIYGAVSDWCEELAQRISDYSLTSAERLEIKVISESMMSPTTVSID